MKILFLARSFPADGATTHIFTIAKGLLERGNEVYIISAGPTKETVKMYNDIMIMVLNIIKLSFL